MSKQNKRTSTDFVPAKIEIPKGFKPVRSGMFAPKWNPKEMPKLLGTVDSIRQVETGKGKRKRLTNVMEVVDHDGVVYAVWESAALDGAFTEAKPGDGILLHYQGLKKIPGKPQPMKVIAAYIDPGKAQAKHAKTGRGKVKHAKQS